MIALVVILFIKQIMRHHARTKSKFELFWDNDRIQRARMVKTFLDENGIEQIYNVPYSPSTKRSELLWAAETRSYREQVT